MVADSEQQVPPSTPVPTRWDVVVFRTLDTYECENLLWAEPPITDRVVLGHDVFIERLDGAVARTLSKQCSAGALESQSAQRYSFVTILPRGYGSKRL